MVEKHHERREDAGLPGTPADYVAIQPEQGTVVGQSVREVGGACKAGLVQVCWGSAAHVERV